MKTLLHALALLVLISYPSLAHKSFQMQPEQKPYEPAPRTDQNSMIAHEQLLQKAKQGFDAMPPKGTCVDCSDAELQAAIDEMTRF